MATNRDRFALIESISTISSETSDNLRETLDRVVGAIARSMEVEVCSLYLFDPQRERLVLRATIGLDRDSVGRVSMRVSEGLVGLAIESQSPVVVEDAMSHPRYKYFPETGEERYHTFLGVTVQEGRQKPIGVLVPDTVDLLVVETEQTIQKATASAVMKPAKLETGLIVNVPPFVGEGDKIKVDTSEARYIQRIQ